MYQLQNTRIFNNFSRQGFSHSSSGSFYQLKPPIFTCTPHPPCTSPLSIRRTIIYSATSSNLDHQHPIHPTQRVDQRQQPHPLNTPPPSPPQDPHYHILEDDYSIPLAPPPMASITRIAYSVTQPARAARTISQTTRSGGGGGGGSTPLSFPSSLLVIALTLATAAYTAVRQRVATVKQCSSCRGYGIQRCKLCSGQGTIEWEGKMKHREPCPMCLGKRFNNCSCCGGVPIFAHKMFRHADKADKLLGKLAATNGNGNGGNEGRKRLKIDPSTVVDAPSVRRKNKKNGLVSDQRTRVTIDDSEAWMEEVMMD